MPPPPFGEAFQRWLAFLAELGFRADAHLNPPAAPEAIARAEAEVGFAFPDDLRALYLRADGQRDTILIADPAPGKLVLPLFGNFEFVPLREALRDYRTWKEIFDEEGEDFAATYNGDITARAGDPVHAEYWHPGWFPFANDGGGNAYAVDLSPAPGGRYGQVILIGRDEYERRVLAPSLADFFAAAGRLGRPRLDSQGHWASFDAEAGR